MRVDASEYNHLARKNGINDNIRKFAQHGAAQLPSKDLVLVRIAADRFDSIFNRVEKIVAAPQGLRIVPIDSLCYLKPRAGPNEGCPTHLLRERSQVRTISQD